MDSECPNCDDLARELAVVEAERDRWIESARMFCQNEEYWRGRAEAAEARLAAVEALCDRAAAIDARCEWMPLVRAAARGEGNHIFDCDSPEPSPIGSDPLSGEGDQ